MSGSNSQILTAVNVQLLVDAEITKIDRMDNRGFFTSHYTRDGKKTLCGRVLDVTQTFSQNGFCRSCERIAARCQIQVSCGV